MANVQGKDELKSHHWGKNIMSKWEDAIKPVIFHGLVPSEAAVVALGEKYTEMEKCGVLLPIGGASAHSAPHFDNS